MAVNQCHDARVQNEGMAKARWKARDAERAKKIVDDVVNARNDVEAATRAEAGRRYGGIGRSGR